MPSFFTRCKPASAHGSCEAIDRKAMATCDHYERGEGRFCAHTFKRGSVTGECYSPAAAGEYSRAAALETPERSFTHERKTTSKAR